MAIRCGIALAAWLIACAGLGQQTWHVRTDGSDSDTGLDWDHAWCTISNAMTNATANDTILVANGIFTVTEPILVNKAVTISGYPANTNTVVTKQTNGNFRLFVISHSNAVVEYLAMTNGNANTTLPGMTWQTGCGGAVNMSGGTLRNCLVENNAFAVWGVGGGIHASGNSTISNCVIRGNRTPAGSYGAGIGVYNNGANVRIVDCVVSNNGLTASAGAGGGLYMTAGTVERCLFINNRGDGGGGGVFISGGLLRSSFISGGNAVYGYGGDVSVSGGTVSNCVMQNGVARGGGGGAYITSGLIVDCVISNNKPIAWSCYTGAGLRMAGGAVRNTLIVKNELPDYSGDGGGVYLAGGRLESCTIADNQNRATHSSGGTLKGGGIFYTGGAISNCIIFGNTTALAGDDDNLAGSGVYDACWYSCSTGLVSAAQGNLAADPLFAGNGDYRLKSKTGRWNGTDWVVDAQHSPCIDKGPPLWDFTREPADNGGRINMGFDANTGLASKSRGRYTGACVLIK